MYNAKVRWNSPLALRTEIEQARHRLALPESQFRPLKVKEWHGIEKKIRQAFLFSQQKTCTWCHQEAFLDFLLEKLMDAQETVWLLLSDKVRAKHGLYEGGFHTIRQVLNECHYGNELYVASKKYEWLLYIDYNEVLHATGGPMPERLQQLKAAGIMPVWFQAES